MSRNKAPKVAIHDRALGNTLSALSAVAVAMPEKFNFTTNNDAPNSLQLRWRHLAKTPAAVGGHWFHCNADESAGKRPKKFNLSVELHIDREVMDKALHSCNAKPAVAYRLGSTVMWGSLPGHDLDRRMLGLEHEDDTVYKAAMGIGDGPLDGSVGVHDLDNKTYIPLETGVTQGRVVRTSLLPISIPSL